MSLPSTQTIRVRIPLASELFCTVLKKNKKCKKGSDMAHLEKSIMQKQFNKDASYKNTKLFFFTLNSARVYDFF